MIMNLWATREESLIWLRYELAPESEVIQEGFDFLNKSVSLFDNLGSGEGETLKGKFCQISAITLAKSSHLLLGCYSLAIDALAQESGALLRPLIETYELLVYFRQDMSRVDKVIDGKLPPAGEISGKISGDYEDLRKYLNDNASHFSYKSDSIRHLFDSNIKAQSLPTHSKKVFEVNLNLLNAFQVFVVFEALNCLSCAGYNAYDLAYKIEHWRDKSKKAFSHIVYET